MNQKMNNVLAILSMICWLIVFIGILVGEFNKTAEAAQVTPEERVECRAKARRYCSQFSGTAYLRCINVEYAKCG